MKKNPSYTSILAAIQKAKTVKQLTRVQNKVIYYAGAPYKVVALRDAYNNKNFKLRKP